MKLELLLGIYLEYLRKQREKVLVNIFANLG